MSQRMAPDEQQRQQHVDLGPRAAGVAALAVVQRQVDALVDEVLDDLVALEIGLGRGEQPGRVRVATRPADDVCRHRFPSVAARTPRLTGIPAVRQESGHMRNSANPGGATPRTPQQEHWSLTPKRAQPYHQAMTAIPLADRMGRLGHRVGVRGAGAGQRAGGRRAARSSTWRSASPTSTRRRTSWTAGQRGPARRARPTTSPRRAPELARPSPTFFGAHRPAKSPRTQVVIVTPGAKPIMFFAIMALCAEGDEVLYPDPGFPMYESITSFAGATPVPIPLREEQPVPHRPDELAAADHAPVQAADHQLAAQPVRQRAHPRGLRAIAELAQRARPDRAHRRGVLGHPLRRRARQRCSTSTAWPTARSCWTAGPRRSR